MIADRPRDTVIVGQAGEVGAALEVARGDGRLVAVRDAVRLPDGRVQVVAALAVPEPRASTRRRLRWAVTAFAVVAGAALLGAVVWAIVALVAALVAWVTAHLSVIVGGGVALLVLLCLLGRGRVHCPGCPR